MMGCLYTGTGGETVLVSKREVMEQLSSIEGELKRAASPGTLGILNLLTIDIMSSSISFFVGGGTGRRGIGGIWMPDGSDPVLYLE